MIKIKGAAQKYNGDTPSLVGYQEVTGHMVFDIKLGEGFRRKARYVEPSPHHLLLIVLLCHATQCGYVC